MAKFITSTQVNAELEKLFRNATSEIILISPYIKLHERLRSELKTLIDKPEVSITIVFGKNEDHLSLSLGKNDLDFFKEFPNIEIRYEKHLHAKYYANESTAILTSMNLYDYSQNNNIEFGILLKTNLVKALAGDGLDGEAYEYFTERVIKQATLLFKREPKFESAMLGISKSYKGSVTIEDITEQVFNNNIPAKSKFIENKAVPSTLLAKTSGFCIRTGIAIPFNPKRPMSDEAYKNWSKFSNPDYAEKFCHFSGESSNGETSFNRPILKKNWNKAKEIHGL